MKTTFQGEIEFICRRVAMCEHWEEDACGKAMSPEQCPRALKAVRKLNEKLVLGNNKTETMLYEEVRVCHDLADYL